MNQKNTYDIEPVVLEGINLELQLSPQSMRKDFRRTLRINGKYNKKLYYLIFISQPKVFTQDFS